jgi:hypothetical protein
MNTIARNALWPRLVALALCLITAAAAVIAVATRNWRTDAPRTSDPLAPGLAALDDRQLSGLLPPAGEFPPAWTVKTGNDRLDRFGYSRIQPFQKPFRSIPAECANMETPRPGTIDVEVSGRDPADRFGTVTGAPTVRLAIGREFDRSGFDAMVSLASRCSRFSFAGFFTRTIRILEDSRPANGPQRFRMVLTTASGRQSADGTRTEYFSFARTAGLVLSGSDLTGKQQLLDTIFASTLRRIGAP